MVVLTLTFDNCSRRVLWRKKKDRFLPNDRLVTFFFCREQQTIDKLREQSEKEYPGSYPPDWEQPAGFEWVTLYKLRQIKRKFQVIHGNDPRRIFKIIDRDHDGAAQCRGWSSPRPCAISMCGSTPQRPRRCSWP